MSLALHIIAKDEVDEIERIIKKYYDYFDEIAIAYDKEIKPIYPDGEDKVSFYKYNWTDREQERGILDFARKRNFLDSKIESDYIFRLDTDDVIKNPKKVREVYENAQEKDISVIYCWYSYSKDEWGNENAGHNRTTLYRNSDNLYWNKPIHENILAKSRAKFSMHIDESIIIDHKITHEKARKSAARNIKVLLEEYNEKKEDTDPRTLAYLGRMLFSIGEYDKSIFFLEKHIENSGWDEDRYMSYCTLGDVFIQKKNWQKAIACCNEALQERPDYPDAYFKLHDIYFHQELWQKAIQWGKMGFSKPKPKTLMVLNPSSYGWQPKLTMAYCLLQVGKIEEAYEFFQKVKEYVPEMDWVKENEDLFEEAFYNKKFKDRFLWLYRYIKDNDKNKLKNLLNAIPNNLLEDELLLKLRKRHQEPKTWSDNSVVIMCGKTSNEWHPGLIDSGVGGSEEAAIHMAKQFDNLGYDVTVFNNCGENEGNYDGVEYKNWYKFNVKDNFNIIISWRSNIFEMSINADKKILWLHDRIYEGLITKEGVEGLDKIIVLSKYHKSMLPDFVPENKIYMSTNGLVPEQYDRIGDIEREEKKVIYASSYDRGLHFLLGMWSDIRKEVPEAELHIYYGWETFDSMTKGNTQMREWKKQMIEMMDQEGIYENGRVGHLELLDKYAECKLFAYPSVFEGEINCMALTKAVACGCYCLTNSYAAIGERNPYEIIEGKEKKETLENFKNRLIELLKTPYEELEIKDTDKYIKDNSWERIAKSWNEDLI